MLRSTLLALALLTTLPGLFGCEEKKELAVTKIYPRRGPFMGGDPVTISGTGFSPTQGITVYFGKNQAKRPIIKETGDIVVYPPAGENGTTVDVEIVFDDARTLKIPKAYSYFDPTDIKAAQQDKAK